MAEPSEPSADRTGHTEPSPVKRIAFLLSADREASLGALAKLVERWGCTDHDGTPRPFDLTNYYESEMGSGLERWVVSFARLLPADGLVDAKLDALQVEDAWRGPDGRRRVNIDPGYLDLHKVVLASLKPGAPKIYLGRGTHADMICRYSKGMFTPFEWTFEDFRRGLYDADLLEIRRRYKAGLRRDNP